MASSDASIHDYFSGLDLEVVEVARPRGGGEPEPKRLPSIAALQARLRSKGRGKRPDLAARPPATDDVVLLRVRSRKDPSREFTVIYSRKQGAIVGEQDGPAT